MGIMTAKSNKAVKISQIRSKIMDYHVLTLLHAYNKLDKGINMSSRLVDGLIEGSYSNHSDSVFSQTDKIITLLKAKSQLIILKDVIEKMLVELGGEERAILVLKYIKGLTSKEITEKLYLSLRTYFRRIKSALLKFEKVLKKNGYDSVWFLDYADNPFLKESITKGKKGTEKLFSFELKAS